MLILGCNLVCNFLLTTVTEGNYVLAGQRGLTNYCAMQEGGALLHVAKKIQVQGAENTWLFIKQRPSCVS